MCDFLSHSAFKSLSIFGIRSLVTLRNSPCVPTTRCLGAASEHDRRTIDGQDFPVPRLGQDLTGEDLRFVPGSQNAD